MLRYALPLIWRDDSDPSNKETVMILLIKAIVHLFQRRKANG